MEPNIVIRVDSALGKGLKDWWAGLENDRASRAMLRRCATLDEVVLSPAYQRFYRYMLARGWPTDAAEWQKDKLAAIAGLAAWVDVDIDHDLPYQMSERDGDRPVFSELRFRAVLKLDTTDELYKALRRALPLVKHKTSLVQLANDVFWWGDTRKKHWAYSYRWPDKQTA
jgi:CRISPR system Cascade subunit CasB